MARFLMRCVFTFFAEDAGLLPANAFQDALDRWRKDPRLFVRGLESLWDAMNTGGLWGPLPILHFNGGLFSEYVALDLGTQDIDLLFQAARFDWAEVDPSIFGTLLESALDSRERHRLGAHYTPRAYVERLLRPALEEPLRQDWDLAQAEALSHLSEFPTEAEKAEARTVLHRFQHDLAHLRILDPACGSGNFLAAAYDTLKRLEGEVQRRLQDMGETEQALALEGQVVTPKQFMGIEVKPWAAAIADMVLWIGHLQWHRRLHPGHTPPEPVLQAYGNIACRDAVLTWTDTRETGRTHWDGVTTKPHSVTGREVPDESAQLPILEYLNSRPATWPEADFIVGNPPFIGNKRMRDALGDGYAEALRAAYPAVPDSVDFVLYWWHKAAEAVKAGHTRRFGLITTNSLTQTFNRRVISHHMSGKPPLKLLWAIPDHPWTDDGAAVRIAMSVGGLEGQPWLGRVIEERSADTPEAEAEAVKVESRSVETIHDDLSAGANVASAVALKANGSLVNRGMTLVGKGFLLDAVAYQRLGKPAIGVPILSGRDLTDEPRGLRVLDAFGLTENELRMSHPTAYQHLFETVRPERMQNNRPSYREKWWVFAEPRGLFRPAARGLARLIFSPRTAKHRAFSFIPAGTLADSEVILIASEDAFHLGVLSSRVHLAWATAAGSTLEDRPRYNNSRCFDPFPFPDATESQRVRIRDLAERLDAHRKAAQARGVTITGMYNLLAKLRAGESFTPKDREQHEAAQTEILRQIHDELDAEVAGAYGWPIDLPEAEILERLVTLNRERAAEEARGLVRWLRPEYQARAAGAALELETPRLVPEPEPGVLTGAPTPEIKPVPWPTERRAQLQVLRDLLLSCARLWSLEDLAKVFKSRGRYRDSIQAHLGVLEDLGLVDRLDTPEGLRWSRPTAAVV
ncbi:DNA methyltransferase [Geothrix sp.]|uniref:class I SAM-dependent DNA methyltransferase n=1 Tax=Geothrix sp. TaxID=1962974 RepID=UPI0025C6D61E|nr:DNA methyltransferase [Geothrix sp.]